MLCKTRRHPLSRWCLLSVAWRDASAVTHPEQLLVLLLQLAFQVPHPLLDAPVTLLRLHGRDTGQKRGRGGRGTVICFRQPDCQQRGTKKKRKKATAQAKASIPNSKMDVYRSESKQGVRRRDGGH